MIVSASGKANVRVLLLHGKELHRCELSIK
jgi:hypothetical protein